MAINEKFAAGGIAVDGLDELSQVLDQMAPKAARNLMRSTIHGVASEIAKEAKRRAPRDEGTLKRAIKTKRRRPKHPDKPFSDVFVTKGRSAKYDAYYWRFVEYGTTDQPERPFFRPAIDAMRPEVPKIMKQQFGKKLEAMLKRAAKKAGNNEL